MNPMKEKYISLVSKCDEIPIFYQPWWLDAVSPPDDWDVVIIEDNDTIRAAFVFVLKKRGPFTAIGMPELTPYLGFWVNQSEQGRSESELLNALRDQLPKHDKFFMRFDFTIDQSALTWPGFEQTGLYTYVLNDIADHDNIYQGFKKRITGDIKKATKSVQVEESDDVETLYNLCRLSFQRQDKKT